MLLDHNSEKVKELFKHFDFLKDTDKLRLAIYLLEYPNIILDYEVDSFITLLKEVLGTIDPNYKKVLECMANRKHLVMLLADYSLFGGIDKKKFLIEMLFNIYNIDFKDEKLNELINKNLNVYDFAYSLLC